MKIINTEKLTCTQSGQIRNLVGLCKLDEGLDGILFMEQEMNAYPDFPCFFLLYDDMALISFLSIFIPNKQECEIYGYTLPAYRNKGCFLKLLESAASVLNTYGIHSIFFACEPKSISGKLTLNSINAQLKTSEYMMRYNNRELSSPKRLLGMTRKNIGGYQVYVTFLGQEQVGKCKVDCSGTNASIFDFKITKKRRGQGYGKETLLLILNSLINNQYKNILLHLTGDNKAAYHLYSGNGFDIIQQVDYWRLNPNPLCPANK